MPLMTAPASKIKDSSGFNNLPRYRAPSANAQALVEPSLALALRSFVGFGAGSAAPVAGQVGGYSLSALRTAARREAIEAAIDYTSSYRELWFEPAQFVERSIDAPWLVAGHQPELFHPGVWFKNFLLSEATKQTASIALNLVIDNDLCRSPAIRVPIIDAKDQAKIIRTESLALDAPSPSVAWECRSVLDRELLSTFPKRLKALLPQALPEPLANEFWPHVMRAAERTGQLGLALAQARHAYEAGLGLRTLELPLSVLAQQKSFAKFSLAVLADLPRFQEVYNQQRAAYRAANGIRSQSHPVPALQTRHGWFESPWWIYRQAEPTRRRLFARIEGDNLMLSDQAGWQGVIEGPLDSEDALTDWMQMELDGVLLRPRALITTMFTRLVISDLFLHGIGGGKYDQLTDAIIRNYFDIPAPPMIVATATLRLPLADELKLGSVQDTNVAMQQASSRAWDMRFHPEKYIASDNSEIETLLNRKRELLEAIPPRGEKWDWHREITRVNQRLAELNSQAKQINVEKLQELAAQSRQLKLATSREFSFCLFARDAVVGSLERLATNQFDLPVAK